MARRTKSYFAKSNRGKAGAVFVNNVIANSQKRKKQEAKAAEAASRRRAREAERERARRAKEEERKRIQLEKEAERKRKEKAKLDAKENAVSERLKLEFPKAGLYPGKNTIAETARQAVRASISPAKARSFFIDGNEEKLAKSCAVEYLLAQKISSEYHNLTEFSRLRDVVAKCRPQTNAVNDPEYKKLKKTVDQKIEKLVAQAKREKEREDLISSLLADKVMFKDEIEEFAEIIEKKDWDKKTAKSSPEYSKRIKNKSSYVSEIKAQISPLKLSRSAELGKAEVDATV